MGIINVLEIKPELDHSLTKLLAKLKENDMLVLTQGRVQEDVLYYLQHFHSVYVDYATDGGKMYLSARR